MTITTQFMDEYLADYKTPWGARDWTFAKFDDQGVVITSTKATLKSSDLKQPVYCIFLYDASNPEEVCFRAHYLSVGESVLVDDGYADEFFANLNERSSCFN